MAFNIIALLVSLGLFAAKALIALALTLDFGSILAKSCIFSIMAEEVIICLFSAIILILVFLISKLMSFKPFIITAIAAVSLVYFFNASMASSLSKNKAPWLYRYIHSGTLWLSFFVHTNIFSASKLIKSGAVLQLNVNTSLLLLIVIFFLSIFPFE